MVDVSTPLLFIISIVQQNGLFPIATHQGFSITGTHENKRLLTIKRILNIKLHSQYHGILVWSQFPPTPVTNQTLLAARFR